MSAVEYDLLGAVGVRLVDASADDATVVDRQLGPIRAPLARPADITIRFVERGPRDDTLRFAALDRSGWTTDDFVVLRSKHKAPAWVVIPVDRIGEAPVEIVVERGAPAVPYLVASMNLVALSNGVLPLHASAFVDRGRGVLVTGWSKGGKTESLLAFVSRGAEYVGDEWVYVRPETGEMLGLPEPIRVWDWQLDQLPLLRQRVSRSALARMRITRAAVGVARRTALARKGAWLEVLERQRCVDVAPDELFGRMPRTRPVPVDRICFVGSSTEPGVTVGAAGSDDVARRMTSSLRFERLPLWLLYQEYRYAFPHRRNAFLEGVERVESELLHAVLSSRACIEVTHPYPVDLAALHDAMSAAIHSKR
jgi:hypothetical protein